MEGFNVFQRKLGKSSFQRVWNTCTRMMDEPDSLEAVMDDGIIMEEEAEAEVRHRSNRFAGALGSTGSIEHPTTTVIEPPNYQLEDTPAEHALVVGGSEGPSQWAIPPQPPPRSAVYNDLRRTPPPVAPPLIEEDDSAATRLTADEVQQSLLGSHNGEDDAEPDPMNESSLEELLLENKRLKDQNTCGLCCSAKRDVIFIPCGHILSCWNCAQRLSNRCPVCRNPMSVLLYYM